MPLKTSLDMINWKILHELQGDGRITNIELSRRVGISAPPCLRRVKYLEDIGIIKSYRALLNTSALGMDIVAFCMVGLFHQTETEIKAFSDLIHSWPIVREAWMVSGATDFVLHCVSNNMNSFQKFVMEKLTAAPNVDTVRTAVTINQIKNEGLMILDGNFGRIK